MATRISTTTKQAEAARAAGRMGGNAVIVILWLWLYRPVLDYLRVIFGREDFRTSQLVLIGAAVLILWQAYGAHSWPRLDLAPRWTPLPLALALGSSLLYLLTERFLDVNTLSGALCGLATYGLLGLWLDTARWRQGLPAALLLIAALPFGEHLQTFIGYPLRIVSATVVRDGLAFAGAPMTGVDTILVFENSVTQVDLPCSGIQSLWTGLLFLLAATWIERRPLNWRWLGAIFCLCALLLLANVTRVGILVVVGQVAGWRLAAAMLHIPLGVLGFVGACAAGRALLSRPTPLSPFSSREGGERQAGVGGDPAPLPGRSWRSGNLAPFLAGALLIMVFAYVPRPVASAVSGRVAPSTPWALPAELTAQLLPLSATERSWLIADGAQDVERYRFTWRGLSGSFLLITSTSWRAHHRPERCFQVYGLTLDESRPHLAGVGFPLRVVTLRDRRSGRNLAAAYWFQAVGQTTDDYGARIWADLSLRPQPWVLVSILFDGPYAPDLPDVDALYGAIHATVERGLASEPAGQTVSLR